MAGLGAQVAGAEVIDLEQARRDRAPEPYVSKRELAEHFGCSPRTVERWLTSDRYLIGGRRIPHHRIFGGPYRFKIGEVESWLRGAAS